MLLGVPAVLCVVVYVFDVVNYEDPGVNNGCLQMQGTGLNGPEGLFQSDSPYKQFCCNQTSVSEVLFF